MEAWAFFGGSFDPPHLGHVLVATLGLASGEVGRILAVPCFRHAFGKEMAPFDDRVEMCRLAFAPFGDRVEVSTVEQDPAGAGRTLDTLRELLRRHPERSWRLLVGSDILAEKDQWHRFDEVARLAPPLVVGREGHEGHGGDAVVLPDVASSDVRAAIAAGRPWEHLVPAAVAAYVRSRSLYLTDISGRCARGTVPRA